VRADGEQALDLPSGTPASTTPYGELPYMPPGNTHRRAIWLGKARQGPEWEGIESSSVPSAFLPSIGIVNPQNQTRQPTEHGD